MKTRWFAAVVGALLSGAPLLLADDANRPKKPKQDSDMQRAIEFERYKERAAARQARLEARHPTVFYNNADRQRQEDNQPGKKVPPKDK